MVVFDIAGTTVQDGDNAVAGMLCEALEGAGVSLAEEAINPLMGTRKPEAIRTLLTEHCGAPPTEDVVQRVHDDFQRRMIAYYECATTVRPMEGAEVLFHELRRRGIRVALDTGFDRRTTDAILHRLQWRPLLDDTVASDEVPRGRPAPDMIQALMHRAGLIDPRSVGKVGDSLSDVEQGYAAGCGFVAAVRGPRTTDIIDRFPDLPVVDELVQLLPLMDG